MKKTMKQICAAVAASAILPMSANAAAKQMTLKVSNYTGTTVLTGF